MSTASPSTGSPVLERTGRRADPGAARYQLGMTSARSSLGDERLCGGNFHLTGSWGVNGPVVELGDICPNWCQGDAMSQQSVSVYFFAEKIN